MKLVWGLTWTEKERRRAKARKTRETRRNTWNKWFAWRPVCVSEEKGRKVWAWLTQVERRYDYCEWKYREIGGDDAV